MGLLVRGARHAVVDGLTEVFSATGAGRDLDGRVYGNRARKISEDALPAIHRDGHDLASPQVGGDVTGGDAHAVGHVVVRGVGVGTQVDCRRDGRQVQVRPVGLGAGDVPLVGDVAGPNGQSRGHGRRDVENHRSRDLVKKSGRCRTGSVEAGYTAHRGLHEGLGGSSATKKSVAGDEVAM